MRLIGALTLGLVLLLASPALAETPEEAATRLSGEIMSPFCPGSTLHDCPSTKSMELREQIEGWVTAGWSDGQVFAELESQFGPGLRAVPRGSNGLWVWLLPALALGAGGALAVGVSRRWTSEGTTGPSAGSTASMSLREEQRLHAELQTLKDRFYGTDR